MIKMTTIGKSNNCFRFWYFQMKIFLHEIYIWFIFSNKYRKSSISMESFGPIIHHKVPTTKEDDEYAKNRWVKLIFRFFYFQIELTIVIIFCRKIVKYHIPSAQKTSLLHFSNSDDLLRYGYSSYIYIFCFYYYYNFSSNFIPIFYYINDNKNTNNARKQLLLNIFVIYLVFFTIIAL